MHLQPVFEGHEYVTVNAATDIGAEVFGRGLCLPSDVKITEEEQEIVIEIVKGCFK
jgi:dTDP-4-amino-4,6-dideoxygalactose transaminase